MTSFGGRRLCPGQVDRPLGIEGSGPSDALLLAAEIMKNNGIDRERVQRECLEKLLIQLSSHPLSLELVLPACGTDGRAAHRRFAALLAEFRAGKGETRNESLLVQPGAEPAPP